MGWKVTVTELLRYKRTDHWKMKFIFPKIMIVLSACSVTDHASTSVATKLQGAWSTCGNDGTYCEWYVKEDSYKFCALGKLEAQNTSYEIRRDTIIYNSPLLPREQKGLLTFQKDGTLHVKYFNDGSEWVFNRLNVEIKPHPPELTWDSAVIAQYDAVVKDCEKRAKKVNCPDHRSREEIEQDSLDSVIDFQF